MSCDHDHDHDDHNEDPLGLDEKHLALVRQMIEAIGDDPTREGLIDTPKRVVKSWRELFKGYAQDPAEFKTVFSEGYDQMVVCRGIEFSSFCEHHMLPFFGTASIGYIPGDNGVVIGLSKLARITDVYARRLQVQERLTSQIASALEDLIQPRAVAVVVEGVHTCMTMRGVSKQRARMTTSEMRGVFRDDASARGEILSLLRTRADHE